VSAHRARTVPGEDEVLAAPNLLPRIGFAEHRSTRGREVGAEPPENENRWVIRG
jgi:hypothetical protein